MSIGMLAHEGSIFVVILNGMRLLRYRLRGNNRHSETTVKPKEETASASEAA